MPSETTTHAPRPRRLRKWLVWLVVLFAFTVIGLELYARFGLGLGDPPLMMRDEQIEYLARPSMTYSRFGNRVSYNQWSMRSDEFSKTKSDPNEFRVLVLGDSIVNGGAQTDQSNIATEILRDALAWILKRPVTVGNVSAGSWGPPNLLAYVKKFGLFDANAVVIVLSSHDASDAPTFGPLGVDAPERKPLLALQEAIQRYLPRYLPPSLGGIKPDPPRSETQIAADREQSLAALRELIHLIQNSGSRLLIIQHAEQSEILFRPQPGHADIRSVAVALNVENIDLGTLFDLYIRQGNNLYRDELHPNEDGQRVIADVIRQWIERP